MSAGPSFTVLHFVAAETDRGGILTVVRALSQANLGRAIVAVNHTFRSQRWPALKLWRGTALRSETINVRTCLQSAGLAWRLRAALAGRQRIFHGHSRAGLLVGLWLWLFGFDRVIVTVHCHGRQRWFYRFAALALGERLIWLTPAMKRYYDVGSGSWQGCLPNFIAREFFPNGLAVEAALRRDSEEISRRKAAPPVRPPGASDVLRLGGIGSLVRWKHWELVLRALAQLTPAERSRVEFHHVGSEDGTADAARYAAELRAEAERVGLVERVQWRGEESSSAALLETIDVIVLPADREPFGMAVLEAWAVGVPVLSADDGGPAELITEGKDGWLFQNGSAAALAGQISWLLRTRADRGATPRLPPAEPVVASWRMRYQGFFKNERGEI